MFTLKILGGAALHGPDGPVTGRLGQRRRLALLTVLALGGARGTSRDRLIALFWSESDTERARHSLADAIYQIRRDVGEQAIQARGEEIVLDPDVVASDAGAFEAAIARQDLAGAVALYDGPLLDGFHLPDSVEFERWVDERRAELARSFAMALERLAEEAEAAERWADAMAWWRRLGALDPYNGRVTLRLMSALDAVGDRAGAIRQARVHSALLEHELGAAPDAEVMALAERLRQGENAAPRAIPATPETPAAPDASSADALAPEADAAPAPSPIQPEMVAATRRSGNRGWIVAVGLTAAAAALALALSPSGWFSRAESRGVSAPSADSGGQSVVVLPCTNLGGAIGDEHFSDGLTDELTALLARVHSLRVVARTSAYAYKGHHVDVREIARRLDADAVVECGVRRSGDRFRVTAQLVSGSDGMHLWADTYQRDGTDLLSIQSDLALQITRALQATLTPQERSRLARRATAHPDAHTLYLKGRHFWNRRTAADVDRAVEYFKQAIAIDPEYAAAHAGLARASSLQAVLGGVEPQGAAERMRAAATRAIALDDESADAYAELGAYLNIYAWDSPGSERAFQRSLELDPNNSVARNLYANLLFATGRIEEEVVERRAAARLDPLTPQLPTMVGYALLAAGRAAEALDAFREAVELDTLFWASRAGLGDYHGAMGEHEDALREHRRAAALAPTHVIARSNLARALAESGRRDDALPLIAALRAEGERRGLFDPATAFAMLAVGDEDGALAWLERAYRQKHPQLRLMRRLSERGLADDPRYLDLLRRVGLPPPGVVTKPARSARR